ncbi:hypothetical protein ACFV9C_06585 [Kribbella sp. NPDC059898]|uniref:hypothetical protein n=1 Tax=Kribbella sp. NPDC059898 TaxID=3346995 RepID=UPI0036495EE8
MTFVASEVLPVVYLTVSVIDGTDAVWAQIVGVVLVLFVAACVTLAYWWWLRRHRLRWIPVGVLIVCSVAALTVMIAGNSHPTPTVGLPPATGATTPSGGSTGVATPTAGSPTPTISVPAAPTTAAPRCWTAAGAGTECGELHRLERIGGTTCDLAAAVRFLGGNPAVDVVTAQSVSAPGGGCAVRSFSDVSGSSRNVLQTGAGGSWRRCYDRRTTSVVTCAQLHSSEYVATGDPRRPTLDECVTAAQIYLDQELPAVQQDLTVTALSVKSGTADPARCTIDARGNHLLTASVRSLGSSPVPVQEP